MFGYKEEEKKKGESISCFAKGKETERIYALTFMPWWSVAKDEFSQAKM